MTVQTPERRSHGFGIGLLTGTLVGAGLALWLAPRMASELRERMTDSAKGLGRQAQDMRDVVADAVARGAHEVERYAVAAKSGRLAAGPVERNVVSGRNA
jgi:gas vesicle protein